MTLEFPFRGYLGLHESRMAADFTHLTPSLPPEDSCTLELRRLQKSGAGETRLTVLFPSILVPGQGKAFGREKAVSSCSSRRDGGVRWKLEDTPGSAMQW